MKRQLLRKLRELPPAERRLAISEILQVLAIISGEEVSKGSVSLSPPQSPQLFLKFWAEN